MPLSPTGKIDKIRLRAEQATERTSPDDVGDTHSGKNRSSGGR